MVLVLALAALAIYGVVYFIKRLARPQEIRDPHLKVLARIPLGSDSFAAVLSLGARAWLVGGGSGGINLISEVDDAESLETMLLDDARKNAETGRKFPDFRSLLGRLGSSQGDKRVYSAGADGRSPPEPPGVTQAEALRKQRERLKGL
jgi:flagellar protein FliO/FliZ